MQLTREFITPSLTEIKDSVDITLYKGTTFRATFTFKNANETPLDLMYTEILFNFVKKDGTPFLIIQTSNVTSNGSIITIASPPQSGTAELLITDEETTSIDFEQGHWWLTLDIGSDKLLRGRGKVFIKEPYE
jgi:hypothetical protein